MLDVVQFLHLTPGPHLVVAHETFCPWLESMPIHKVLARRGKWYLFEVEDNHDQLLNRYAQISNNSEM